MNEWLVWLIFYHNTTVLCIIVSRNLIDIHQCIGESCCLQLQGIMRHQVLPKHWRSNAELQNNAHSIFIAVEISNFIILKFLSKRFNLRTVLQPAHKKSGNLETKAVARTVVGTAPVTKLSCGVATRPASPEWPLQCPKSLGVFLRPFEGGD